MMGSDDLRQDGGSLGLPWVQARPTLLQGCSVVCLRPADPLTARRLLLVGRSGLPVSAATVAQLQRTWSWCKDPGLQGGARGSMRLDLGLCYCSLFLSMRLCCLHYSSLTRS